MMTNEPISICIVTEADQLPVYPVVNFILIGTDRRIYLVSCRFLCFSYLPLTICVCIDTSICHIQFSVYI